MGLLFVAAYFGFGGVRALWTHFAVSGMPSSAGELATTSVLVAVVELVIAWGLLMQKMWARHGALGSSFYSLGKILLLVVKNPAATLLGLYYLAPLITFFSGLGLTQMLILVVVGAALSFGSSLLIIFLMMRKSCIAGFLGADDLRGTTFYERSLISRDYLAVVWILVFLALHHFQAYVPKSFYKEKDKKDFAIAINELKNSDGFKKMREEQDQQFEAELRILVEFSADEKNLYLQLSKKRSSDATEFYTYNLTTYKLKPMTVPKAFDLQRITHDRRYLVGDDRQQLFDLNTWQTIPLKESIEGSLADPVRGYTSLGFGPLRDTYLKYYQQKKSMVLYDFTTSSELRTYSVEVQNPTQLAFFSFPSKKQGILMDHRAPQAWHWQWTKESLEPLNNLPSFLDLSIIADEDEGGFFALKRNFYQKEKSSFMLHWGESAPTLFSIDGDPIAFSIKNDFLIYTNQAKVKKISLKDPTQETTLVSPLPQNILYNSAQNMLFYRDANGSLGYKNVLTNEGGITPQVSLPHRNGSLKASQSGNLITMSSGRVVQVFWKSEFGKPQPRFLKFEIPKKPTVHK